MHVPETWLRAERERSGRNTIGKIAGGLLFAFAGLAALVAAVRSWLRNESDNRAMALVFAIGFATSVASIAVMWPSLAMQLKTTEPDRLAGGAGDFGLAAGGRDSARS